MARENRALDREQVFFFNETVTNGQTLPEALAGTATQYPIFDASGHRRLVGIFASSVTPAAGFPRVRFYDGPLSTATVRATYVFDVDTATTTQNLYKIDIPLWTPWFTVEWTHGTSNGNVFGVAWVFPEDGGAGVASSQTTLPGTYRCTFNALAAVAGNFMELRNPASSGRVLRVTLQMISKPSATIRWVVRKQSSLDSGGTSTAGTVTALDSSNATTVGAVKLYTAAPTQGTLVGNVLDIPSVTAADTFADEPGEVTNLTQPIVLRAGQSIAWTTDASATIGGIVEFTDAGT